MARRLLSSVVVYMGMGRGQVDLTGLSQPQVARNKADVEARCVQDDAGQQTEVPGA